MTASIQLKFYIFIIFYQKLIGLAPYSYNHSKKKFQTQIIDLIYPILIISNYSYFYYILVSKFSKRSSSLLITLSMYGRSITTLLSWFVHCAHRKDIVKFFNIGFQLNDILNKIPVDKQFKIIPAIIKSGILTVISTGLLCFAKSGMLHFYINVTHDEQIFTMYAISFINFALQSAITTTFFGITFITKLYFERLNNSKYIY